MEQTVRINRRKRYFLRFLVDIGTSGKYTGKKEFGLSDYLVRYVVMNCNIVFGFFVLIAFAIDNFRKDVYSDAIVCVSMAIMCLIGFILGRTKVPQSITGSILYFSYGLMCIVLIQVGEALGANFLFIFVFPPFVILQFGLVYGVIIASGFFLIITLQLFAPGLSSFHYQTDIFIRILVGYFLVFFVTILTEITRKAKDRMIKTQNQWLQKLREEAEEVSRSLETAVKERTRELEEQTSIAINANRAKSEFLATMSHEIRTPLNAVIGLSEIELRGKLPESSRNNIQQIYQSGSSLLRIINDILDISKIEAGSFQLVPTEYDTASFINDTVNLNRVRLGSKIVTFILEINGDFPRKLIGDELRVKQILNNLLSNAIKYTDKGTVTLSVTCSALPVNEERGEEVLMRFTVRDTGKGIRKLDMEKLFTSYTQLEARANRKIEGTGLGLAITKNLVEMMGGSIIVESEYGKGSVFAVEIVQRLPEGRADQGIGEEAAENLRNFHYESKREKRKMVRSWMPRAKVLIVDDMPVNIRVARGMLEPYGLQIDSAVSAHEAIELVKKNNSFPGVEGGYDIIFMDHMMPEMDGVEATLAIRAWENQIAISAQQAGLKSDDGKQGSGMHVPIVALTANAIVGMKEAFIRRGFDDFLTKPIDITTLDEILSRWIPKEKRERPGSGKDKEKRDSKKLIILVDDETGNLQQGRDILLDKFDIVTTPSAAKLFQLLEKIVPALILLDTDMPDTDGYKAIEILKSKPGTKDIPVVLLTEKAGSPDDEKIRSLGAAACLSKPFDPAELIGCIEKYS